MKLALTAFLLASAPTLISARTFAATEAPAKSSPRSTTELGLPAEAPSGQIVSLRIRPLAAFFGIPGGEVEILVSDRLSLGPTLHFMREHNNVRGSTVQAYEIGLKAVAILYRHGEGRQGWYACAALNRYLTRVSQDVSPTAEAVSTFEIWGGLATLGHQWTLRGGNRQWTVRLGAGAGYRPNHTERVTVEGRSFTLGVLRRLDPIIDFSLGFAI